MKTMIVELTEQQIKDATAALDIALKQLGLAGVQAIVPIVQALQSAQPAESNVIDMASRSPAE